MSRDTREVVVLLLAATVCSFVMGSLVAVYLLAKEGHAAESLWAALFALVASVLSALGGYLGGVSHTERKQHRGGAVKRDNGSNGTEA